MSREELAEFKFSDVILPCNEKEDFNTDDVSVDIICRVYLSKAPSKTHEKIAKKLDKENYNPECFYIEAVAGKNFPDEPIVTSGWMLYYVLDDGTIHEFGYVADDIDGAWEFFKKQIGVEF